MGTITEDNINDHLWKMVKVKAHKDTKGWEWFSGEITGKLIDYDPATKKATLEKLNRQMVVLLPDESIELIS
jgi:hypothetical protein